MVIKFKGPLGTLDVLERKGDCVRKNVDGKVTQRCRDGHSHGTKTLSSLNLFNISNYIFSKKNTVLSETWELFDLHSHESI